MKNNKSNNIWAMGQNMINTLDIKWEHPAAAVLIMAVCGSLDFVIFRSLFASFLNGRVLVQWLSIMGMLIGFDLVPIYLGMEAKKRKQGLNVMNVSRFLGVTFTTPFIIAFALNLCLHIALKDQMFPNNERALLYALFTSFLPVVTSIVSFSVSFAALNPLKQRTTSTEE